VFKIPLKRGRAFNGRDDNKSSAVVVINERMAEQYWKGGDPLGERIAIGRGPGIQLRARNRLRHLMPACLCLNNF
jgi:hypothetical protein